MVVGGDLPSPLAMDPPLAPLCVVTSIAPSITMSVNSPAYPVTTLPKYWLAQL